jgi:pilus assembly protein CpaF
MNERDNYKQLKTRLHRKILDRLDLKKLGQKPNVTAQEEVLRLIRNLISDEVAPLTAKERDRLSRESFDEIFGLGPLEPLRRDIRHGG